MMRWQDFGFRLVLFLATNGLMTYVAWVVARTLARGLLTRVELLATAIVIMTAQVVATHILLGLLGLLIWWLALLVNTLVAVGLLLIIPRLFPGARPACRNTGGAHPRDPLAWGVLLTVGVMMLVALRKVVGMPPFGTDSLGYHLPVAVEWLQTGKILIGNPIPFAFYPGVSELVDLWLLLPFHDSLLVNLQNWPFALLTVLALYSIARRIGIPVRWAVYGSLFFIGIRAVQLTLAFDNFQDNDVMLVAFFLIAVNLGIAAVYSENRTLVLCEGIALGLLVGTKYSGWGYALLVGAAHIFLVVSQRKGKRLLGDIVLLATAMFVLGGFWYVRNWIDTGNPLPPVAIRLAGHVLFPGQAKLFRLDPQESTILARIFDPGAFGLLIDRALLEKGGLVAALSIPALLFVTLEWGYRTVTHKQRPPLETALVVLLSWGTLVLLLVTPLAVENEPGTLNQLEFGYSPIRYGLPFLALGGLVLARLLSDERWWGRSWLPEILAVLAVVHSMVTMLHHQLEFSSRALSRLDFVTWVGLFAVATAVERVWHIAPRRVWHWFVLVLLVVLATAAVLWPAYQASLPARLSLYEFKWPGYTAFRQQVEEQGAERVNVVGYNSTWFVFSGEGLTTRVIHCPESITEWMDCLDANRVELVAFAQGPQLKSAPFNETAVVQQYAGRLVEIFSDKHVHVYRVVP